jgi:hypothetical protein
MIGSILSGKKERSMLPLHGSLEKVGKFQRNQFVIIDVWMTAAAMIPTC